MIFRKGKFMNILNIFFYVKSVLSVYSVFHLFVRDSSGLND